MVAAIDKAIGKDGLRVVLLLRLSPLLPLAASNYLCECGWLGGGVEERCLFVACPVDFLGPLQRVHL